MKRSYFPSIFCFEDMVPVNHKTQFRLKVHVFLVVITGFVTKNKYCPLSNEAMKYLFSLP